MLNKEREQEIVNILTATNGFVTVKHLCDTLYASESSIRRDLKSLEAKGVVKRTYGGAELVNSFPAIMNFSRRSQNNIHAKRAIAKKAAALVEDGSILFLDQSSTSFYLAEALTARPSVTVVTNNIEIMMLLSNTGLHVISSGGYLNSDNRNCLLGPDAERTFRNIYADTVFFSVKSVTDDGIVSDFAREEVTVRGCMLDNAARRVFLCDSTKFGTRAAYTQCMLTDVDILVAEDDTAARFSHFRNLTCL